MRYCLASSTIALILFGSAVSGLTIGAGVPAVAQMISDRKAEADRLIERGNQQRRTSNYRAALQSYQQALVIYQEIRDRNGEADALMGLDVAYRSLSQYLSDVEKS